MLAHLALGDVELSIALVDDATIRALNRDYRDQDRPTDVLAFATNEAEAKPRAGRRLLGDVVLSIPTAARQATRQKRPLLAEVTMLLAHGILHLCGYDHATKKEERVMVALTRELEAAAVARHRRGA